MRMKGYEKENSHQFTDPTKPLIARIDGRGFSKFTKGNCFERPFDHDFSDAMIETAHALLSETNAKIAYTQSDEISLIFYNEDEKSQHWFNGKQEKMVSQLAALASVTFYNSILKRKEVLGSLPTFDCRLFEVPTKEEACNYLIWREKDAIRNSIGMYARSLFSHKQLEGVNSSEKLRMIDDEGESWYDLPMKFRLGSFLARRARTFTYSQKDFDEMNTHKRRGMELQGIKPGVEYERSAIQVLGIPKLVSIANREEFVFDGADYIVKELEDECS